MNHGSVVIIIFAISFVAVCGIFLWLIGSLEDNVDSMERMINSYQETTRTQFNKIYEMNAKLSYQQEEHDKMIEVLRLRLDKLIEKEKQLTFDSTDPGYHRELLKTLTELRDIKDREKKLNEEIDKILQTGDL